MSRHHLHPLLWASLVVFSSCGTPPKSSKTATPPEGGARAAAVDVVPDAGLVFELSEGEPSEPPRDSIRVAETEPISSREAESLLSRLPALQLAEDDEKEFSIRPQSPPPPRAGTEIAGCGVHKGARHRLGRTGRWGIVDRETEFIPPAGR